MTWLKKDEYEVVNEVEECEIPNWEIWKTWLKNVRDIIEKILMM